MIFRACEVLSRIISLGIFQLALRNETVFVKGFSFQRFGGAAAVGFDFIIMFILIAMIQGCERQNWFNCIYSLLSVFVFINPLMLQQNGT